MRPGQNKRMRGRPNNSGGGNRKGPNPLTRSYESNGPDVKIRGNAHHVAEKYLQLARDAQSSGDPVAAESYLQHAEHYFRLIASAQAAQAGYARQPDAVDADMEEDDDSGLPDRFASPQPATPFVPQTVAQPYGDRQPYNGGGQNGEQRQAYGDRQANGERPQFGDRNGYNRQDRNNQDRNNQDRSNQDRSNQDRSNQDRNGQNRRAFDDRQQSGDRQDRPYGDRMSRRERYAQERQDRQERNGQERSFDRNYDRQNREGGERYRDPAATEQPRDPYAGEQPRIEPSYGEHQPDYGTSAPTAQPDQPAFAAPVQAEPAAAPEVRAEVPRRRERPAPQADDAPGLPSFITTPTRVPTAAEQGGAEPVLATATAFPGDDAESAPKFPRRRRRTVRPSAEAGDAPAAEAPQPASGD